MENSLSHNKLEYFVKERPLQLVSNITESEKILYFHADAYFVDIFRDIEKSTKSIDIEMFIWTTEKIGSHLFLLLKQAAQRGVKVRLILDGIGSIYWLNTNIRRAMASGIEIKVFHPFFFSWSIFTFSFRRFLHGFGRLNRRDHRKLFLIDEKIAYTGSINVMDAALHWRESGIRLTGNSIKLFHEIFEDTWELNDKIGFDLEKNIFRSDEIRCNQSFTLRRYLKNDLLERIKSAKNRVWVMTPYFIPSTTQLRALRRAAKNKVDVRIILPALSDIWFLRLVSSLYYRYLLSAGIKIFEYKPKILHAKMMIIDDWSMIGSSNLNNRSTYLDLELDVIITENNNITQIEEQFIEDMKLSERITEYRPMSAWKYAIAAFLYKLRAWF